MVKPCHTSGENSGLCRVFGRMRRYRCITYLVLPLYFPNIRVAFSASHDPHSMLHDHILSISIINQISRPLVVIAPHTQPYSVNGRWYGPSGRRQVLAVCSDHLRLKIPCDAMKSHFPFICAVMRVCIRVIAATEFGVKMLCLAQSHSIAPPGFLKCLKRCGTFYFIDRRINPKRINQAPLRSRLHINLHIGIRLPHTCLR